MAGSGPHHLESMGSQREEHFQEGQEGSVHTTYSGEGQSRGNSHVSQDKRAKAMQKEIDYLKKKLQRERRRRSPSGSDLSSNGEGDDNYRHRSRTPPSETFSYDEDNRRERREEGAVEPCSHLHEFAQFHIAERRLPPLPYKHLA
ncbi:hypothetical protein SO802_004998 [Lithocarpus litseifolius]|uniref:Uncharacterized protein n=1 Tax=Lithocarpus litseifolius TaxID=425828 RepID=A0AAW2DKN5_9ROSI